MTQKNYKINTTVGFDIDNSGLQKLKQEISNVKQDLQAKGKANGFTESINESIKAANDLERILNSSWNSKLGQLDLTKVNNGMKQASLTASSLKNTLSNYPNLYNQFGRSILESNIQLKESSKLLDKMAITMANTVRFGISSSIFNSFTGSLSKAYNYAVHLDTSLNNIRIVSGQSAENMAKFAKEANNASKQLGATTLDYTNAALIYYQQGLGEEQVRKMTDITLKMANVTKDNAEDVSSYMTAIWNNFNDGSKSLEYYADVITALGAATASSSSEIAEGLGKFASIGKTVGLSYEYATAALATVVAQTRQSADTVGTAFKTLFARIQDLELGNTLDDGTTLGTYAEALNKIGINIKDSNGEVKEMDTILNEMGAKWKTIDEGTQIAVAQAVAGTRQYTQLVALMSNWETFQKNVNVAQESSGELTKQNDTYLESVEAHLKSLQAESERTYNALFDEDTVKGFYDVLKDVLGELNDFIEGFGSGAKALSYFGSVAIGVFNKQIAGSILKAQENFERYKASIIGGETKQDFIQSQVSRNNTGTSITENSVAYEAQTRAAEAIFNVRKGLTQEEYQQSLEINKQIGLETQKLEILKQEQSFIKDTSKEEQILGVNASTSDATIQKRIKAREEEKQALVETKITLEEMLFQGADLLQLQKQESTDVEVINKKYNEMNDSLLQVSETWQEIGTLDNFDETFNNIYDNLESGNVEGAYQIINSTLEQVKLNESQINEKIQAGNLLLEKRHGDRGQEIRDQQNEIDKLEAQNQSIVNKGGKTQNMQKAVTYISAAAQGVTALTGAVKGFSKEGATGAEKANAIFSGLTGTASAVATAIGGPAVGAVVSFGMQATKSLLEVSGLWEGIENIFKSTEEKMTDAEKAANALGEEYVKTKAAADELSSTIEKYKELSTSINSLEKGTTEWKQAIVKANDEALKLLDTYESLAQYAERDKDGLIVISEEGFKQVQNQQLEELQRKQLLYTEERSRAATKKERIQIDDFKKTHTYGNNQQVSDDIIRSIAVYMDRNGISKLSTVDLDKIDGLSDISDEMHTSIAKNIDSYSALGNSINDTKKQQSLYAGEIYDARKKLKDGEKEQQVDKKEQQRQDVAKNLYTVYTNDGQKKQEDIDKRVAEYEMKVYSDYMSKYGKYGGGQGVTPKMLANSFDTAQLYAEKKGYDTEKIGHGGFLGLGTYKFYDKSGKKQEEINTNEISKRVQEIFYDEAKKAEADDAAKYITNTVSDFMKQSSLDSLNNFDATLGNIFRSGAGGKLTAGNTSMSQDQAKELLSEDNLKLIKESLAKTDFWERQGFSDAESYYNAYKKWLEDRSKQSDATTFGTENINVYNTNADKVISQSIKGELTPEQTSTEYNNLSAQLEKLKNIYPELTNQIDTFNDKTLIGTSQWKDALYDIQIALSNLEIQEKIEDWNKSLDTFKNDAGEIEININDEKFKDNMDDLLDKDYTVTVTIQSQMDNEFDQVYDGISDIDEAVGKIQEGWKVSRDDIVELGTLIPGIADNYKIAADGLIQLDQDTAQSAIKAAQVRMETSKQETIKDLENAAKSYNAKADAYDLMAIAATKAADQQISSAEAVSTINGQLDKIDEENKNLKAINEQENSSDTVEVGVKNTQTLMDANTTWAKHAIANAQQVAKAMDGATKGDTSLANSASAKSGTVSGSGAGAKTTNETTIDEQRGAAASAKTAEDWKRLAAQYTAMAQQNRKAASRVLSEAAALKAASADLTYDRGHAGSGSGGKKGSSNKSKDLQDNELDRYEKVNTQLGIISKSLSKLQTQKDKLIGDNLIKNLNKQIKLLNDQITVTQEKMRIAKDEASEYRNQLRSDYGANFDSQGVMINYANLYGAELARYNSVIASYNSGGASDEAVSAAQKRYNNFKDLVSKYDTLISGTIPELENNIEETLNKEIELNVEEFNMEFKVSLDLTEAKEQWQEFKKKVIDQVKDDDFLGLTQFNFNKLPNFFTQDGYGQIQEDFRQVKKVYEEIEKLNNNQSSSTYLDDIAKAYENLKEANDQLQEDLSTYTDILEEIRLALVDEFDKAQDDFDKQINNFESISDTIDHQLKMIEYLFGEDAYEDMLKYYEEKSNNMDKQIQFQQQEVDFWRVQLGKATEGSEEWEAAKEKFDSAVSNLLSSYETQMDTLTEKYTISIKKVFDELNKGLMKMGLEDASSEWELINKESEEYLNGINAIYKVQELQNKYLDSINGSKNISAQQKLKKIMDDEVAALKEQDKLSQYDLDRADLRYQIALKQIALEEAQANKSTMRLKRDSQGNYSYVYTADNDEVAALQNQLSDLYNQLYNLDSDKYKENLEKVYSLTSEFEEKVQEIYQDASLTEEEREEKKLQLTKYYGDLINNLTEDNEDIKQNLQESTLAELFDLYSRNNDEYVYMTQEQEDILKNHLIANDQTLQSAYNTVFGIYDENVNKFNEMTQAEEDILMNDFVPAWTSTYQTLIDSLVNSGGFKDTIIGVYSELDTIAKDYFGRINEYYEISQKYSTDYKDTIVDIINVNNDLIPKYDEEVEAIRKVQAATEELTKAFKAQKDEAIAAADAAQKSWEDAQRRTMEAARAEEEKKKKAAQAAANTTKTTSTSTVSSVQSSQPTQSSAPSLNYGSYVNVKSGVRWTADSYGGGSSGPARSGTIRYINLRGSRPYNIDGLGWIRKQDIVGYDTGGYTGNWNSTNGKLAMLHEKELVLNKGETKDIRDAVEIVRNITNSLDSTIISRLARLTASSGIDANTSVLEQNVHIEASFPNVNNSNEIEEALNNLVNVASQKINR